MAKSKVKYEDVAALCDLIYIETGSDPRYEDLTPELHCSNSTVKFHLQEWLERPRPARHPIPKKLADRLQSLTQCMWGHAFNAAVEAAGPDNDAKQVALERSEDRLTSALQLVQARDDELTRSTAERQALMREIADLQVRLQLTESMSARCSELEVALERMRGERDAATAKANEALGQVAAHKSHIDSLVTSMQRGSPARGEGRRRTPGTEGELRG